MIAKLRMGDAVKVWPKPGLLVLEHAGMPGRFLPEEGKEMSWSDWLQSRVMDGSVVLTDPRPPRPVPVPEKKEGA